MSIKICTIDWETLGIEEDAVLLELGYTIGDADTGTILRSESIPITEDTNRKMNRKVNFSTIDWWINKAIQSPALYQHIIGLLNSKADSYITVVKLTSFLNSLSNFNVTQIWCTDKNFDYLFLKQLCNYFNLTIPLKYNQSFDCRHMRSRSHCSYFNSLSTDLVAHSALDDSIALFDSLSRIQQEHGIL